MSHIDTEMCVHEQYRCAICDHQSELLAERRTKEARKRKPKAPTTGLPLRMDPMEKLMNQYASGARCYSCEGLRFDGICECRRTRKIRNTIGAATQFAGIPGAPLSVIRSASATISTITYELGSSMRVKDGLSEADRLRATLGALR